MPSPADMKEGTSWIAAFPGLSDLPGDVRARLRSESRVIAVPRGRRVFGPGSEANDLLLLLDGVVRVQQTSESGRDIVLYRVEGGESCVLTTAFLWAEGGHATEGIAETDLRAVTIPRAAFDRLMAASKPFRDFVLSAYANRINDLFRVIDDVAFGRIDVRLAARLLALAGEADSLAATHAQLATELGTAREVISRQLQDFQRRGLIAQSRGRIALTERAALAALAES